MTGSHDYDTLTIVMQTISKSQLKSQLLEYLRKVEKDKKPLIVTHVGKPTIKISAYQENPEEIIKSLHNSVISYQDPAEPVGEQDWDVYK